MSSIAEDRVIPGVIGELLWTDGFRVHPRHHRPDRHAQRHGQIASNAMVSPPANRPRTISLDVTAVARTIGAKPVVSSRTIALATNAVTTRGRRVRTAVAMAIA